MAADPNWGRAGVKPPDKYAALGDPTRWGATARVQNTGVLVAGQQVILQSEQFISVQCRDGYPRAWTIAGMINTLAEMFAAADYSSIGASYWGCSLFVTMGLGQTQIIHNFNLRAVLTADSPYYYFSDFQSPFTDAAFPTKAFIIPGAVIGTTVGIQVFQTVKLAFPPAFSIPFTTSVIVTPFDPGAQK
jgi:hypothetical protein